VTSRNVGLYTHGIRVRYNTTHTTQKRVLHHLCSVKADVFSTNSVKISQQLIHIWITDPYIVLKSATLQEAMLCGWQWFK